MKLHRLPSSERGDGAVYIYMVVFAILCSVFYLVTGWIYESKEERVAKQIEQSNRKRGKVDDKALRPKREVLGYKVTYDSSGKVELLQHINPRDFYPY